MWLIYYYDQDARPEMFAGEGAEVAAMARFEQMRTAWTCVLLKEVARG
jgi:hypothetical protein